MTVSLTSLWLPVLLSAVVVFIASSIVHMVLTYHRTDFGKLPAEAEISDALRKFNVPPGDYIMPHCSSPAEMKTPEFKEKWKKGPRMIVTVLGGGSMAMGSQLGQWFLFCVVVSLFAGYVTSRALDAGRRVPARVADREHHRVSRLRDGPVAERRSGTNGAHATAIKGTIDGLIYGLLTGGVFGWLWPMTASTPSADRSRCVTAVLCAGRADARATGEPMRGWRGCSPRFRKSIG